MHFVVLGDPFGAPGVSVQAHDLVNLVDPDALADLTPDERAMIVNFLGPAVGQVLRVLKVLKVLRALKMRRGPSRGFIHG